MGGRCASSSVIVCVVVAVGLKLSYSYLRLREDIDRGFRCGCGTSGRRVAGCLAACGG